MDYSNFIRSFYRYAITELKKFKNYYGKIVNINRELDIPDEFLHSESGESKFLPNFSVVINAPTKYFVEFMSYFVGLMPDLGFVLADSDRINSLYNNAVNMGIIENDDEVMRYIDLVIGTGIKTLVDLGILAYGD